jgi:hypothetical protein
MPDKQGKMYTICCKTDDTFIYVGCTTQSLCERMAKHKYDSINKPTICFYQFINDLNDWYIELYEKYPCENKEQLNKREGEIIRSLGTVNKTIAGRRTVREYYQTNKDILLEKMKEYRQDNKESKVYDKEYANKNIDKINEYQKDCKQNNKDKIKEYQREYNKEYYETEKEEMAEQREKKYHEAKKHNK